MTVPDRILRVLTWAALLLNLHWWLSWRWARRLDEEYRALCAQAWGSEA